jgi:hypothetical protein
MENVGAKVHLNQLPGVPFIAIDVGYKNWESC